MTKQAVCESLGDLWLVEDGDLDRDDRVSCLVRDERIVDGVIIDNQWVTVMSRELPAAQMVVDE